MRSLSIKTYLGLFSILMLVAILSISIFIIYPTITHIREVSLQIAEAKREIDDRQTGQNPTREERILTSLIKKAEPLANTAVEPNQTLKTITELEALADTYRINQSLKFDQKKDSFIFTIKNTGAWNNLVEYIDALERLPYYVIIPSLDMTAQRLNSAAVTMQFTAKIYVQNK